ncbi:leucine-rich repeat-containing protein 3-like [Salarias fasciatus]|uniref:leucine-rich repeat-containing protein 3-like n=1 Tax=Salarias fasciatus TaxID=181472 RepID=UPI0011770C45|nr:leucine-rich repeat-containing protein 3-like [Salarias fasciatus]
MMVMVMMVTVCHACPRICHCSDRNGLVVQCTSRDLDHIPPHLPKDTAVLLLSSNRIRHLPKGALADLHLLRELDLSQNALDSVEADAFQGVSEDLQTLDLSQNQLSSLPRDTFSRLHAQVRLSGNPWHCECSLQEVLRELRLDPETVNEVTCFSSVEEEYVGHPVIQVLDSGVNFCNFHHKTMDLAMFVAMFCWFSMVSAYIIHYIRHNQEDARRHMEYLKTLPSTSHLTKDPDTASSVC